MRFWYILALCGGILLLACHGKRGPNQFAVWGLDVSRHQEKINWLEVTKHERPNFVLIKATEGTLIKDPSYARHARELEKAGIPWGAYHFFGHRTPGKEQAQNFIRTANLKAGNIIPVLDIEPHRFMTDPKKSVKEALDFCHEIESHYGTKPIIYCSMNFYNAHLKQAFPAREYTLWIADYRGTEPQVDWHLWQHTQSHRIRGISGKVDRNVFVGTEQDFQKLILR